MPFPVEAVASGKEFQKAHGDAKQTTTSNVKVEFLNQLRSLVEKLLNPRNVVVKQISGREKTCRELVDYFKVSFFFVNVVK
ncbi:unnamed protein product [Gongylonema pulchrum]|uniref:CRM domain-containing protein n=1 Tax=Gongylonema pulchrum TaxID=637853 RepID=A0A183EHJ3_9BILA|nr:unnamed protein product [Gongylonema pulchrum]